MKGQTYLFERFVAHDKPKDTVPFDADFHKEELRPCIIILGGVSSSGKTTTADAFVNRFTQEYPQSKISIFSQDNIISDDLNKKCKNLTDLLLSQKGFDDEAKQYENLHLLSLEKRSVVDAIRIYSFRSTMYSALAKVTTLAIVEGSFVLLDVIDITFMLGCLLKTLPVSTPIITGLLFVPLNLYPERILRRNEQALAKHRHHGKLSLILKDARLGLLKTSQYGDLYYASDDYRRPNIGYINRNILVNTLEQAANQQKQLIISLLSLYHQHINETSSEDEFFARSLKDNLNDFDIKARGNIALSYYKIMGNVDRPGVYITPKYTADFLLDTSKLANSTIVDSLMSKFNMQSALSGPLSLGFRMLLINPDRLKDILVSKSLQMQKIEHQLFGFSSLKSFVINLEGERKKSKNLLKI
jgi:uridine kinase